MSRTSLSIHVRDASLDRVVALVIERFAVDGFIPVTGAEPGAASARRVVVHAARGWCSFADEAWTDPDAARGVGWTEGEWAAYLATKLRRPVLTLWTWDGEASVVARRYEGGKEVERLELLSGATRGKDGRVRARADVFAPWLAKKKGKAPRDLVLDDATDPDAEDGHVFVSLEDSIGAIAAAIGLPRPWLSPHDPEPAAGDRELFFARPVASAGAPPLPQVTHPKGFDLRRSVRSYGRRDYAIGWLAFDARAGLAPLDAVAAPLVSALCPVHGYEVRVTRGGARQSLARRFSPSSRISPAQLQRGGAIELSYGSPDVVGPGLPLLWVVHRPDGTPVAELDVKAKPEGARDAIPFVFGWCIPATGSAQGERALANAMESALLAAVALPGCIGALVTAQGDGATYGDGALAYERLAGTVAGADRAAWIAGHVRAPGWRVLVPTAATKLLAKKPPAGVRVTRVPAGALVHADGETPFAQGDLAPVARYLLPAAGSQAELARGAR